MSLRSAYFTDEAFFW